MFITATSAVALLERAGYVPARYAIEMVRPHLDDPPPVELPPGIDMSDRRWKRTGLLSLAP